MQSRRREIAAAQAEPDGSRARPAHANDQGGADATPQAPIAPGALRPGRAGSLLARWRRTLAIAGGLVFVALVAMSIVSIVGRKLFAWPVPGDVEMLQMCAAFASSAFFA